MKVKCVWEHNGDDSILYASNFVGAFTRGKSKCEAIGKMSSEISAYLKWKGALTWDVPEPEIIQEKVSTLTISDADSDVLFDEEKKPLSMAEYEELKSLALKSARDFLTMYEAVPDKDKSVLPVRQTFYGEIPRSAYEMYEHTKNVNAYYFGEIGVQADNNGTIEECRKRGFELLEHQPEFLENKVYLGSYDEESHRPAQPGHRKLRPRCRHRTVLQYPVRRPNTEYEIHLWSQTDIFSAPHRSPQSYVIIPRH